MKTKTTTDLKRLENMVMMKFNQPLKQCSIRQMQEALELLEAEDDIIHNHELITYIDPSSYYGLLEF